MEDFIWLLKSLFIQNLQIMLNHVVSKICEREGDSF